MSSPVVSILMPSYNHEAYVVQAARSALESADAAGVSAELRVLDDGSRDETVARLQSVDDPRLLVEVQENAGAHAAFNRLLESARGDFIFLLNSDDLYERERIARCLERLAEPTTAAVGSFLRVIDDAGSELGVKEAWRSMPPWPRPTRGPALVDLGDPGLALLETNYLSTTSNLAFRRSWLADGANLPTLRFLPLRYCHDWDFMLGLCQRGDLALIEQPLVRYRVHGRNTLKETDDAGLSEARMRFEILWLLARHGSALCRRHVSRGSSSGPRLDEESLRRRLWSSLPRFGCEALLGQLLTWRGEETLPPASYDALLDPAHPFRLEAETLLLESRR